MSDSNGQGIAVQHLFYSYSKRKALEDVNLTISKGTFCALLGPNGAGKSTLFSLFARLLVPRKGKIFVAGIDIAIKPNHALSKMGFVFQQPTLDLDLSVQQNLAYYAALRGIAGREARTRIGFVLDRLGIAERAREKTRALNGGHRRRTEIARALLGKPEILLLDEPTVGLDTASRATLTEHVHTLCQDENLTVLWATHLVDEVRSEDDLVVLHNGKILRHGHARDIAGKQTLNDAFLKLTEVKA